MSSNNPLLQPFQLKHLRLKNRLMTSSHEPAYTDNGLPKERYRLYHAARAQAGLAMTMTAGLALVSKDSPPAFGNILAYREEVVPWMRKLLPLEVRFTLCHRAIEARREGERIRVSLGSDYVELTSERVVDQIVVEHGTIPLDSVYFELKPLSTNLGEVDYDALIDGKPQQIERNAEGKFKLFRIGDAVASRNIHAAIYDALRLVKDL
jgi:hypothetical protein